MKRTLNILLAGLALSSCTIGRDTLQEVRFSSRLESGAMTKATRTDTIQALVASRMPKTIDLSLKSRKTGTTYRTRIGEGITIPVGKYGVSGLYWDNGGQDLFGASVAVCTTPSIRAKAEIDVRKGVGRYELATSLNCIGLVIDRREVEQVLLKADRISNAVLPFEYEGDYGIVFVNGELGNDITLTIEPKNLDTGDAKTIKINGGLTASAIQVKQGRYYILHPYEVEREDAGFDMNVPTMGEVDLK